MGRDKPGLGLLLMVMGFLGVIGCTIYTLTYSGTDIDDIKLASTLNFIFLLSFMLGSILEIKDLWNVQENLKIKDYEEKARTEYKKKSKKSLGHDILMGVIKGIIIAIILILLVAYSAQAQC